jgi:hypothetical protein
MNASLMKFGALAVSLFSLPLFRSEASEGKLQLTVIDSRSGKPVPCRVHLKDSAGKTFFKNGLPRWRDHFVCDGIVELDLPSGNYSYEIERGPEYRRVKGTASLSVENISHVKVELERLVDLAAEGWWSGDLHVHRPVKDIELLMKAEDLHMAPVITWWNNQNLWTNQTPPSTHLIQFDRNRFYEIMAGEDEREGGALLFYHLPSPLPLIGSSREFPSPMEFVSQARRHPGVWIDIEKPFWWDVPVWVASRQIDSIGIANNHMCRDQMYESEAWGKPRDAARLPAPRGNGFWTQEIYYNLLNCGLRIPPSAGSASGVLPNPVGYNRVYVHTGKTLSSQAWWEGLRQGHSFVSNGPLLRCRANGKLPGHIFKAPAGREIEAEISGTLDAQDPISTIEIIKVGKVEGIISLSDRRKRAISGKIKFTESGWFLVRVLTDNPKTFRFASTAPFYVEIGNSNRRISRASAQFFLDWVRERKERIKLADAVQREQVLRYHEEAERFWGDLVRRANTD